MQEISRRDFLKISGLALGGLAFSDFPDLGKDANHKLFDVLSPAAQDALAVRAQTFIRPIHEDANALADTLRNNKSSDANNICGPLALAQLTGIATYGVRPQDFWLLDPSQGTGQRLLAEAFPVSRFDRFSVTTPLINYDFGAFGGPGVQPGDFFFFRAKDSGSPHMVAISRRGVDGKIYCVTNYPNSDKKFITKEVVFWDPVSPNGSWVKELAKGANASGFSSGNAGFYQYRLKEFQPSAYDETDQSKEAVDFRQKVADLARGATGEWHVMVKNLSSGKMIAEVGSTLDQHSASQFKVALAMVFLSYLEGQSKDESDYINLINTKFGPAIKGMLVLSDEDNTNLLTQYLIDQHVDRQKIIDSWKVGETDISHRHVTADALTNLFARIWNPGYGTFKYKSTYGYLKDLLSTYSSGDATRFGLLPGFGLKIGKIYDKRGSIDQIGGDIIVGDSGIVEVISPKSGFMTPYALSMTGHAIPPEWKATYDGLGNEIDAFVKAFADYAKKVNG